MIIRALLISFLVISASSCGEHDLSGGGQGGGTDKESRDAYAAENNGDQITNVDANSGLHAFDPETVFGDSPDERSLKSCFREWGSTPFTAEDAKKFKILTSNSVGFGSRNIADRARTKEPVLVLVKAASTGFGNLRFDLGNPNAYYCFQSSTVGFASIDVMKHCRANLGNFQQNSTGFGSSNYSEYGDEC